MKQEKILGWIGKGLKEIAKGLFAFVTCCVGIWGFHPILPAYFAVCAMEGKIPFMVAIGSLAGMFCFMTIEAMIKYFFVLVVIALGTKFFLWMNRSCDSWAVGMIAALATIAMNISRIPFGKGTINPFLTGICEGVMVFGIALAIHGILGIPFHLDYFFSGGKEGRPLKLMPFRNPQTVRMESLAYAVSGLSDAFFTMSYPKESKRALSETDKSMTLENCDICDSKEACWRAHHGADLKHAWNNRLMENRYVIAKQLEAMADLLQEWTKLRVSVDEKYQAQIAKILYGAKEKGLIVDDVHVFEEKGRLCIEGCVSTRWNGGIPMKHYLRVVEKAIGRPMRAGKDCKNILNGESAFVTLYEDTKFYGLQGIATQKKNGSVMNGDSFSFFTMDDGSYHICLSDGMGSGSKANEESEMVVEMLQKFMEAGFKRETALELMNSAMMLQGEESSFPTLDYGVIDMYTGELEVVKIGGVVSFIKHGENVECIDMATLPAGANPRMKVESVKRKLRNGDFLVMVSDGVIEYLHVRNPKETMVDMLSMMKTENAGVLAEQILNQVMIRNGGIARDDITILVTGIWEK